MLYWHQGREAERVQRIDTIHVTWVQSDLGMIFWVRSDLGTKCLGYKVTWVPSVLDTKRCHTSTQKI